MNNPRVKFIRATGEIIAAGYMPDLTPDDAGQAVEEYTDGEFPEIPIRYLKRTAPGRVTEKSQAEKDASDAATEKGKRAALAGRLKTLLPALTNEEAKLIAGA